MDDMCSAYVRTEKCIHDFYSETVKGRYLIDFEADRNLT